MENEKTQLTAKLAHIEHENSIHEQQLQSEQLRIKELQFNIQMLNDHNNAIKRDCINEERNYEQEKSILIGKFERIKQQWTDIFKPQYEQSKVYQYLKKGDLAYNVLIERRDTLLNAQKLAYEDYLKRRQEYCNEKLFRSSILSIAKYFTFRRNQLIKIEQMKEKLIELENKQHQLLESKIDKMKAWENIYNQPVKRDLMDFCLQTNIEQALTLSFSQIQQDIFSEPMTPVTVAVLTPQHEQVELLPTQPTNMKPSITFQSSTSIIDKESTHQNAKSSTTDTSVISSVDSTIAVVSSMPNEVSNSFHRSSVLNLTTAIEDDDDELFSKRHRKVPTTQMEQMTLNDFQQSTQTFTVSTVTNKSDIEVDPEISSISQNDQPITQAFTTGETCTRLEPTPVQDLVPPTMNSQMSESISMLSIDSTENKLHPTVTFQLPPSRIHNRSIISTVSSIQPQVTSNDVQQMLLGFSPDPSSTNEQQLQPMEADSEQLQVQEQQRPAFLMPSSIESTTSTEDGFNSFNYNFGFNCNTPNGGNNVAGKDFTSPINFDNWTNLASPIRPDCNDQFSVFLQQADNNHHGVDSSFSFSSFNYGDGSIETSADGAFGSFFFGNNDNNMNTDQTSDRK